jgi:large subunit ribosomal protein L25
MATLNARPRQERGKSAARALRRSGQVPAVVYGHGDETRTVSVDAHELELLLSRISVENTIIDLRIEGGATTPALIREVQYHPSRPQLLHLDLYQVHAGEKLHLEVPIRLTGSPYGVREQGGILQEVLRDLQVECLPRDIPEAIEFDVTELNVGDSVHVRDLSAPNAQILNDPELVVCTVTTPTRATLAETPETDVSPMGDVEPELIRGGDDAGDIPATQGG